MKKIATILIGASLTFVPLGCGGGDDNDGEAQKALAALLSADVEFGMDTDCISDKTDELSDNDAQFLIDNIDADSADGFSSELQLWVASLFECSDEQLLGE